MGVAAVEGGESLAGEVARFRVTAGPACALDGFGQRFGRARVAGFGAGEGIAQEPGGTAALGEQRLALPRGRVAWACLGQELRRHGIEGITVMAQ